MMPMPRSFCLRSGSASTSATALLSCATIAGGVPALTNRPFQAVTSKSPAPASFAGGTSGSSGKRFGAVVASALQLAVVEVAPEGGEGVDARIDIAAQHGHDQVARVLEGHPLELDAGGGLEHHRREVLGAAGIDRADVELAGVVARGLDEVGERAVGRVGLHGKEELEGAELGHRREIGRAGRTSGS